MNFILKEAANDPVLRAAVDSGLIPSIETILKFLNLIHRADYPSECNIICLIYINRMTSSGSMLLTMENWKGVWLGAVILSQKLWSDNPMSTATFAALVQPVTEKQLRAVESKFFTLIKMVTSVKPSQYAEVRRDVCDRAAVYLHLNLPYRLTQLSWPNRSTTSSSASCSQTSRRAGPASGRSSR